MKLNLPEFEHKFKETDKGKAIFDIVRKKYLLLTPEEWVRQNFIHYLIFVKKIPQSLIRVEMYMQVNSMPRRSDIVVHNKQGSPLLAVECKATNIKITQLVFDQLARYNLMLKVPYLIVTNGLNHYFCKYSTEEAKYIFLTEIPEFEDLLTN